VNESGGDAVVQLARAVMGIAITIAFVGHAFAADIYVVAGAAPGGNGTETRPFSQLKQAEEASSAGDRIFVSAKSAWDVLSGTITLKPNQKLLGRAPTGGAPRYEAEKPRLTSTVVDEAVYNTPFDNGNYSPTTAIVMLARGVEVSGIHFVDMKGPALLAADRDITGTRIHGNTFSGVMPKAKSLIYPIVLGGTVNVNDVQVTDNSFRDGLTLGGITVQQKGESVAEYFFQRNDFRDLGGRAYFIRSEGSSRVTTTILDSTANNIGVQPAPPEEGVPGAGNADSIIPYLTGRSQQRMLVRNYHFKNDKQVGGGSNTGFEAFIYGRRAEADRPNWCVGCRADIEIQDSVFEQPVTTGIQLANSGNGSVVTLAIRRTKVIGSATRQGGAVSLSTQRTGGKGGKVAVLVEESEIVGARGFAVSVDNATGESVAVIDLGGGELGSKGKNIVTGSMQGTFNLQGEKVTARNNWWGGAAPTVSGEGGTADVSSPLPAPPQSSAPAK
jgi:hypothetical protein